MAVPHGVVLTGNSFLKGMNHKYLKMYIMYMTYLCEHSSLWDIF